MTTNESMMPESDILENPAAGPAELRAYAEREKARRLEAEKRNAKLEAKISEQAFAEAGFPASSDGSKSTERKALEKFYQGDRTDPDAIRKFAVEEMGYKPADASKRDTSYVPPAPNVAADARVGQLDAAAVGSGEQTAPSPESQADAYLKQAIGASGQANEQAIEASIAAQLAGLPPIEVPPSE